MVSRRCQERQLLQVCIKVAVCRFVQSFAGFLGLLCQWVAGYMPNQSHFTYLNREVELLKRRVGVLGALLRERSNWDSERGAAVGIPVIRNDQWRSVLIFLAGLWCGCIVSLLALCIGVVLGHSL